MRIYCIHCLRVFMFQVVFSALNNNCWWITSQHCPDIPTSPWSQTVLANHSPNRSFYCMPFVCPCHHYWHQTEPPWCVYALLLESIRSKLSYSELVHSTVGSYLVNVLHRTVCRVWSCSWRNGDKYPSHLFFFFFSLQSSRNVTEFRARKVLV